MYETALKIAGHPSDLKYNPIPAKKKRRRIKPIYFNPPYSINVKTNVGQEFLKLLDKHFPKGSELHRYFNRSKVKISYCTMNNLKKYVNKHNSKILNKKSENEAGRTCNCRKDPDTGEVKCPLQKKCLTKNIVYRAVVTAKEKDVKEFPAKTYYGLTSQTFKDRYNKHTSTFRHRSENQTSLSSFTWRMRDRGLTPEIEWKIHKKAHPYSSGSTTCDLCLTEKTTILRAKKRILNKRDEILNKCIHKKDFLLNTCEPP